MYLLFAALLLILGYRLWPAIAGAAAAFLAAADVARRVLTAGNTAPSTPDAITPEQETTLPRVVKNSLRELAHENTQDGRDGQEGN